jgi:ribokinase
VADSRTQVIVVGSINIDWTVRVERLPGPGETVTGDDLQIASGGKGANQAVAATAAGAVVAIVAAVGGDAGGRTQLETLKRAGVDTSLVRHLGDLTGVAVVTVDASGENQIVAIAGANEKLEAGHVDTALTALRVGPGDVVLTGHEVSADAVGAALAGARTAGATAIVNPAPARALPDDLSGAILTPNESEARELTGEPDADRAAQALHARTGAPVIVTLGAAGALVVGAPGEPATPFTVPAPPFAPIDTTGAGDVFTGALAAHLAAGDALAAAVTAAVHAATASTGWRGARRPDHP